MTAVWAVHLADEDASIVDIVWGPAIFGIGLVHAVASAGDIAGPRLLVLLLAAAWALRLAWHLGRRHAKVGEDRRYRAMREARGVRWWWQSLVVVFLLQAVLAWIVALPLMVGATGRDPLGIVGVAGALLFLFGFAFEAIADGQLARYKAREERPPVMDSGLWRYSRHPNYFGEAVLWWGLGLLALDLGQARSAWWSLVGPAALTFLLLKVSGVALAEKGIVERCPEYEAYRRRTNAFVPGPRAS
jgi:steroid 5-alpha reductase family enzyme